MIGVSVAGLALGAATQLGLTWDGNYQAGAVNVTADCQPSNEIISVGFDDPTFEANKEIPWGISDVNFSGINNACDGLNYEAAYKLKDASKWVSLSSGVVDGTSITAPLGNIDEQNIDQFALTIHG